MKTRVQLQAEINEAKERLAEMEAELRTLDNYPVGTILRPKVSSTQSFPFLVKLRQVWAATGVVNSFYDKFVPEFKESNSATWAVLFGDFSGSSHDTLAEALQHPDLQGDLVEVFVP